MKTSSDPTLIQRRKWRQADRFLFLLIVFLLSSGVAKSQIWDWAKKAGSSPNYETGMGVVTDSSGNVYATGYVQGSSFSLPGFGFEDVFLAKYDILGTLLWVTKCGGSGSDQGNGIAIDNSGSIYITGTFKGIATFQSASPSTVSQQITSGGDKDAYIAKYDPSGVLQWVTKVASGGDDFSTAIAVDQTGGVYITGYLGSTETYFYNQPGDVSAFGLFVSNARPPIFLAKYTDTGTFVWARAVEGAWANKGNGIAVNSDGTKVVVTGAHFGGLADFGNSVTLLSSGPWSAMFVAAYDGAGVAQWAQLGDGTFSNVGHAIAIDSADNVYVTGKFTSEATFYNNPASPGNAVSSPFTLTSLRSAGGSPTEDIFLAKYDQSGVKQWLASPGGAGNDVSYGIALDGPDVLITGSFESTVSFGPASISSAGKVDIFAARYDGISGTATSAVSAGGSANDAATGIAAGDLGVIYVTGAFLSNPARFGANTITNVGGSEDVFVAKLNANVVTGTCMTVPSELVNWWPFDETSGPTAQDIRGLTNNVGTHMNGPKPVTGIVGGALSFDGDNDFVEVANGPDVNFFGTCPLETDPPPDAEELTIDVWVKTNLSAIELGPNSGYQPILDKRVNSPNPSGFALYLLSGRLGFQINGTDFIAPVSSPNVADNFWHFVAVSLRRCSSQGGKLYVDGNPVMSIPGTNGFVTTEKVFIGRGNPSLSVNFFKGALDELEIFKRALTDNEVRALFDARSGGKCFRQACPTITINPSALVDQKWELGVDYPTFQVTATGGTGPYTFTAKNIGSLIVPTPNAVPPGMGVDSDGRLQGKPLFPGLYTFTVTVTDANGCLSTREYQLTICGAITLNPASGSLPAPVINTVYSEVFEATGGCTSDFTYSLTSGALPIGLKLDTNGELWGTATQAGSYDFTVTATDSCGCSQSQTYTLTANVRKGEFLLQRGMNEFCIWGGGGPFNSPRQIDNPNTGLPNNLFTPDNTGGVRFGSIGLCYGRILSANNSLAFKYTFNAIPVAVLSYREVNPVFGDFGFPVSFSETRRNVYGAGLSPIGLQLYFRPQSRIKPFVNTSGGFIFFKDPVPQLNGSRFNFTYDFGGGVQVFRDSRRAFTFGYKNQRISNGGRALNNPGFDGHVFSLGYSIFRAPKIAQTDDLDVKRKN